MPINFKPASQNGAVPPTPAKYKQSKLGLIASTTTSVLGQPIVVKALSDAAYYKTTPVTLYAFNPDTSQTIATTSSFIDTVQAPFVLSNLAAGTWQLWAEWPGDGPFVAKTTQANLISLTVTNTGVNTGGRLTLTSSPASGSLVVGEGTATFLATITNVSSFLGGNLLFYDGNQQIGQVPLVQNHASLSTDSLTAGTHNITVQWPGGLIGGTKYQGFSTSTNYAISSGTVSGTTLNLSVSPNHGVFQEGYITLTASLVNGAANYPGSVVFYRDGVELYTAPVIGTTATYTYRNFEAVGSTVFKANWDGNQASHPRFVPVASSTASWTVVARETPSRLSVAVVPNPTAFSAPTYFTATFHQLAGEPLVPGEVVFYADDIVVGRAPIINDVATTSNRYVMTGTHAVYAYYAGSADEPKFYSTRSETVSLVVNQGLNIGAPLTLTVTNDAYKGTTTPYVKGEAQKFVARITTSSQMTDVAWFAINGVENFSAPWINNSATTTTVFANSGTYSVQAVWHGGQIGGNFYATTSSTVTNLTVLDGYTLTQPITLSPSLVRVINEPLTVTAAVTTSSGMRGTMTFYANNLPLGTAQFNSATNQAILTTTSIASSGSYAINALWSGGYIDDSRLYVGKTANTSTIFVDAAQRFNSLIVTADATNLYATVSAYDNFNGSNRGNVTFYDIIQTPTYTTTVSTSTSTVANFAGTSTMAVTGVTLPTTHYSSSLNSWILDSYPKVTVNYINSGDLNVGDRLTFFNPSQGTLGSNPLLAIASLDIVSIDLPNKTLTLLGANTINPTTQAIFNSAGNPNYYSSVNQINLGSPFPTTVKKGSVFVVVNTYTYSIQTTTSISTSVSYTSPGTVVLGTVTNWTNNQAILPIPQNLLKAGNNNISASYAGTGVIPKYYPYNNSVPAIVTITQAVITANPVNFYEHSIDGSTINNTAYAPITITGTTPTGTANLYDGATLLSTINIASTSTFSWTPSTFNQIGAGTKTLTITYTGDRYNSTATTSTSFIAATRRDTTMTLSISTSNAVSLNPLTFYANSAPTINVKTSSTYFSGQTIQFLQNNNIIGNGSVNGQTASVTIASMSLSTGTYIVKGQYGGDFAYNSTVSNTSSFKLIKGLIPLTLSVVQERRDSGEILPGGNATFTITTPTAFNSTQTVILRQGNDINFTQSDFSTSFTYSGTSTSVTFVPGFADYYWRAEFAETASFLGTMSNTVITRFR